MNIDITSVVLTALAAAVAFLLVQFRTLLTQAEKATGPDWHWVLSEAARVAVRASDQIKSGNEDKLKWATDYVVRSLAQYHLTLDPVLVRGAIESAYNEYKHELEAASE